MYLIRFNQLITCMQHLTIHDMYIHCTHQPCFGLLNRGHSFRGLVKGKSDILYLCVIQSFFFKTHLYNFSLDTSILVWLILNVFLV